MSVQQQFDEWWEAENCPWKHLNSIQKLDVTTKIIQTILGHIKIRGACLKDVTGGNIFQDLAVLFTDLRNASSEVALVRLIEILEMVQATPLEVRNDTRDPYDVIEEAVAYEVLYEEVRYNRKHADYLTQRSNVFQEGLLCSNPIGVRWLNTIKHIDECLAKRLRQRLEAAIVTKSQKHLVWQIQVDEEELSSLLTRHSHRTINAVKSASMDEPAGLVRLITAYYYLMDEIEGSDNYKGTDLLRDLDEMLWDVRFGNGRI